MVLGSLRMDLIGLSAHPLLQGKEIQFGFLPKPLVDLLGVITHGDGLRRNNVEVLPKGRLPGFDGPEERFGHVRGMYMVEEGISIVRERYRLTPLDFGEHSMILVPLGVGYQVFF